METDINDLLDAIEDIPKAMRKDYIESKVVENGQCIFCDDKIENGIMCAHCEEELINF